MHKAVVFVTDQQDAMLTELSETQGISYSEALRRVLTEYTEFKKRRKPQ